MNASVNYDPTSLSDIDQAIGLLKQQRSLLVGNDNQKKNMIEVLKLDCARLIKLGYANFGPRPWSLHDLSDTTGIRIRELHGLTGSLARACASRGVRMLVDHGGQPKRLSLTQAAYDLLSEEARPSWNGIFGDDGIMGYN